MTHEPITPPQNAPEWLITAPSAIPDKNTEFSVLVLRHQERVQMERIATVICDYLAPATMVWLMTDDRVLTLYGEELAELIRCYRYVNVTLLPEGEAAKDIDTILSTTAHRPQSSVHPIAIVALGGGAICNSASFLASILSVKPPLILIPTTNMAQCDVAVGSKALANTGGIKNGLRTYIDPTLSIIDTAFLQTLSSDQVRSGLAESAKHALMDTPDILVARHQSSPENLSLLQLRQIVIRTLQSKISLLRSFFSMVRGRPSIDPPELQYGHTIGHAIESLLLGRILHGHAVALGIGVAAHVATALKIMDSSNRSFHDDLLGWLGFGIGPAASLTGSAVIGAAVLRHPPSESLTLPIVLSSSTGEVHQKNRDFGRTLVSQSQLEKAWEAARRSWRFGSPRH